MIEGLVAAIDVGTQAARCLIVNLEGHMLASAAEPIRDMPDDLPPGWSEQDPAEWWRAVRAACASAIKKFSESRRGYDVGLIKAVAVDSTSGTVVPVDASGDPLRPALMYNDMRAVEEAQLVQEAGEQLAGKLGYWFQPAFALPKILWVKRHEPEVFARTACFLHAADFIVSKLSGGTFISDTSNALKSGYDLVDGCWPAFIDEQLRVPFCRLPAVARPGEMIGEISRKASAIGPGP